MKEVEPDTGENWGGRDLTLIVHELNVTIDESYFDPNKFREYFI